MRRWLAVALVALQIGVAGAAGESSPDPVISAMVAQVAPARLRATDERLVTANAPRAVIVSSVVATLRGDDPSGRTYVISSHLDSRNSDNNDALRDAPGADDNASAVAAVVEAARIFAPRHFAATLQSEKVPVAGNLNSDIIGASRGHDGIPHPDEVRLYAPGLTAEADAPHAELARFAKTAVEQYVPGLHVEMIARADRLQRGGDQLSFAHHGFPAVRFVEASEDYDHQHQDVRVEGGRAYGDLTTFEDFAYLGRVTRGLVASLAGLALGPVQPTNAFQSIAPQLDYDAHLQWDRVPGAAGYDVVWRKTTDAVWTGTRAVGDVNAATTPGLGRDRFVRSVVTPCGVRRSAP